MNPPLRNSCFVELRRSLVGISFLLVVCCGVYPFVVFAVARTVFPHRSLGSPIVDADGTVRGSRLLGQTFSAPKYFHPRPSAAGSGYDAAGSGGSNRGPTSRPLHDAIRRRVSEYRRINGLDSAVPVPADAVTASASGLDRHIGPRNAALQTARVARVRGLSEEEVAVWVRRCTEGPDYGVFGEPGVNVLRLNLALDGLSDAP